MYKTHAKIKRCLLCCPLYGGCPHLGGSVKGGSTVKDILSLSHFDKNSYEEAKDVVAHHMSIRRYCHRKLISQCM